MIDFDDIDDDLIEDIDVDAELARLAAIEFAALHGLPMPDDDDEPELTQEELEAAATAARLKRFEPVPYKFKATKKIIAVVDTETDPFAHGKTVAPFALGFYDGNTYLDFWGDDCVKQFFDWLAVETANGTEFIIYAHNGGKFDFFFFLDYLDEQQEPFIMNGRLVKLKFGGQEFRDSFTIIPQALSAYKKDEIDYDLFTRDKREANRVEILRYMRGDCVYAHELITGFCERFGDKLTVASAALPMLNSKHGFERIRYDDLDSRFRVYYFGGRNQCFETGVIHAPLKLYDRNSMYPAVMRDELHPVSSRPILQRTITDVTDFALIDADNFGALPCRGDDGGLDFTKSRGLFYATGHEIRAGIETGTLRVRSVKHAWTFEKRVSFADFVNDFYNLRLEAKARGDKVADILYKLILNSAYGKFALNPRKFKQYAMTVDDLPDGPLISKENPEGWQFESSSGSIRIWSRPSPRRSGFYNVATAASITGAARANLLRSLALAERPIYCDTDSILCEGFTGQLDETLLGGWKLEAEGGCAAIAGKKLYALFDVVEGQTGVWKTDDKGQRKFVTDDAIKKASKGVRLTSSDILRVAKGETIEYPNPAPTFVWGKAKEFGSQEFITRQIKKTG